MKVERSISFPRVEFRERGGMPIPARAWVKSVPQAGDAPAMRLDDRGPLPGRRQAGSGRDEERVRGRVGEGRGAFLVPARSGFEPASREMELDSQLRSQ